MIDTARRLLLPVLLVLLVACWLGGGVTADDTSIDEWLQLLALPVLLLAVLVLVAQDSPLPVRWGMAAVLLIAAVPALQLLPLPTSIWALPSARGALVADLAVAGVTVAPHWSLAPYATERSLWALLPALAAFLAACALPTWQRRRLLQGVVVLIACNVVFAFFQAGLPPDSPLRLYQDFSNGFGGLLVNTNHQATACIIGMALSVGLATEARLRARHGQAHPHRYGWYLALAGCFLLMVPLSTSRAGMAIALPALGLVLLMAGLVSPARILRSRRALALTLASVLLAVIGVRAGLGWMAVDEAQEQRHAMVVVAVEAGKAQAPLGSGVGSFVEVFEQAAPLQLRLANYVNHAHNEYVQWWLSTGWLGMLVLGGVLALLGMTGWRILRSRGHGAALAGAGFAALCAVLAHSWADYPLRTLTLMATTAAVAGVMLASVADARFAGDSATRRRPSQLA